MGNLFITNYSRCKCLDGTWDNLKGERKAARNLLRRNKKKCVGCDRSCAKQRWME